MQAQGSPASPLDISDFTLQANHGLALWQSRIEPLLRPSGSWSPGC